MSCFIALNTPREFREITYVLISDQYRCKEEILIIQRNYF